MAKASVACVDLILKHKEGITKSDAIALAEELRLLKPLAMNTGFKTLANEFLDRKLADATRQKGRKLAATTHNIRVNATLTQKIKTVGEGDEVTGLRRDLEGDQRDLEGISDSVDLTIKTSENQVLGRLINDFTEQSVLEEFRSGLIDKEISIELFNFGQSKKFRQLDSGNSAAKKIAAIIHRVRRENIQGLQKMGVDINPRAGFVTTTNYNISKLIHFGENEFVSDMLNNILSKESLFLVKNPDSYLREVYQFLIDGKHGVVSGAEDVSLLGFRTSANLGKKVAAHRQLDPKDAKAVLFLNDKYGAGEGKLIDSILADMTKLDRNRILIERLGTNPEATVKGILERNGKAGDTKTTAAFDIVTGKSEIPENISLANAGKILRTVANIKSLGSVVVRSLPDVVFAAQRLSSIGVPVGKAYANTLKPLLRLGRADRLTVAEGIETFSDIFVGSISNRFGSVDNFTGNIAKVNNAYFKLNGLTAWTQSQRQATLYTLSNHLANLAGKELSQLPRDLQQDFLQANITSKVWDRIRNRTQEVGGKRFIDINSVEKKAQFQLRKYMINTSEATSPIPGAKTRRQLGSNQRAGTPLGELVRIMGQFKGFPVTVFNKPVARIIERKDYMGGAHLMAGVTVVAYASQIVVDAMKNKTPRPFGLASVVNAGIKGGAGGMPLDAFAMLVDAEGSGRSFQESISGPVLSEFVSMGEFFAKLAIGDKKALTLARGLRSSVPNLFFSQAVLEYFFFDSLLNSIEPNYTSKFERRLKSKTEQEKIF